MCVMILFASNNKLRLFQMPAVLVMHMVCKLKDSLWKFICKGKGLTLPQFFFPQSLLKQC